MQNDKTKTDVSSCVAAFKCFCCLQAVKLLLLVMHAGKEEGEKEREKIFYQADYLEDCSLYRQQYQKPEKY